jgi:DnaK suppressor protein
MNDTPPALSPAQIEEIRAELLRMRSRLERSMKATRRAARPVKLDQTSVGRLSRIDALQNQSLTQGLEEREAARYAQIQEALRRLEQGEYGTCGGCARPIPFERLLVFPETLTCATCGGSAS